MKKINFFEIIDKFFIYLMLLRCHFSSLNFLFGKRSKYSVYHFLWYTTHLKLYWECLKYIQCISLGTM